ncbi:MAG: hypothetical protein HN542_06450 [Flavobacteriales bacterium]|jgi:hypothetical protein|nr:hypothetical protein [Flavobacteriales bacterium]MBT3962696.1 hypothetical protein [Flavobacteriales bacterium]MBT4705252.1 hypothetical protein [Flavobacteriales bacterium]MBT4931303.1 hypothetical protein [Flavobacteriales bacterium]MBT5132988.1 hypothetical protein [Flavobacteriales bacterium]
MARESFLSVKDIFQDRRKLTVFIMCLSLSIFMWLLISLGKQYNSTLVVPVQYVNFPENKTLLNDVPQELGINVSGTGYDLLQYADELIDDTLIVNLDHLNIAIMGGYQRGSLNPLEISKDLQDRLQGMLAINAVLTDSIRFVFDLKVARVIPIKPVVDFKVPSGFVTIDSAIATPSDVEIFGALSILEDLEFLETSPLNLGQLEKTAAVRVALSRSVIGQDAELPFDSVDVLVDIERLTEKRLMIKPEVVNLPDSIDLLTFPNTIEVISQVPLRHYDDVLEKDFKLVVDYTKLQKGYPVLPVDLLEWTSKAIKVSLQPNEVELVISRKE